MKYLLEQLRFSAGAPVGEVGLCSNAVLHNEISNAMLKPIGPSQDAFDAARISRHYTDYGEHDSGTRDVRIHRVEPCMRDLAGAGTHIGQNHG